MLIEPDVFSDSRGFFKETWNQKKYAEQGLNLNFVQDNISFSTHGVLRGLHFQNPNQQGKLVQVLLGEVYDVAVDLRIGSPDFGRWLGFTLSSENHYQLYVPKGFAHGFCVVSETALVGYKCTDFYNPNSEYCLRWNDPDLAISWPVDQPDLSAKDAAGLSLKDLTEEILPIYQEDQ